MMPLLTIRGLRVHFETFRGTVHALNGVDLSVRPGEILGLVGETGSGKSVTAYASLNLVRPPGRIVAGEVWFREQDLLALPEQELERIRGRDIAMIPQSPRAALNPLFSIGDQLVTYIRVHQQAAPAAARRAALEMLEKVRIADPARVLRAFPHELSTGMCQRVLIAMALSCGPALLIADEPTTGIDVTLQAQILRLITDLVRDEHTATVLITHDLGVVAETCDRVAVMYAGRVVEEGPVEALFSDPRHPYTQGLIASTLRVDQDRPIHVIPGTVPNMLEPPQACMFRFRCPMAEAVCAQIDPPVTAVQLGQAARCHFADRTAGFLAAQRQRAAQLNAQDVAV
ncbi:MAG: ABC transporter ATP-binding protein [Armatimonadota bacterium]|nr:ABC transporter ATP-binding protein [Armatimonadota bacterium]